MFDACLDAVFFAIKYSYPISLYDLPSNTDMAISITVKVTLLYTVMFPVCLNLSREVTP